MKRVIKNIIVIFGGVLIFIIFFTVLITVIVSVWNYVKINNEREEDDWRDIRSLEIRVYTENEEGIYYIDYPHSYYQVTQEGGGRCIRYEMAEAIESSDISYRDFNYITEYIRNLPDDTWTEDSKPAYEIIIEYYETQYGGLRYEHEIGLDELPPDWNRFIKTVNKICGEDYLVDEGDILEVTPELLTKWFGVTDEDVKDGTLQDVINYNNLDMNTITENFSMQGAIEAYYVSTKEDLIKPYRPTELSVIDSTEEEYDLFIQELLASDAENMWVEKYSSREGLRYFYSEVTGQSFYLGRTSDFDTIDVFFSGDISCSYRIDFGIIYEDPFVCGGPIYAVDFVYSPCGKYIFVYETCPEMIFEFLELEIQ